MLKIKFLALTHPVNLHHGDDIYNMVLATILIHNMIVKEQMDDCEVEDGALYSTIVDTTTNDEDKQEEDMAVYKDEDEYSGFDKNIQDRREKAQIVHKRWEHLYDNVGPKHLRMQ